MMHAYSPTVEADNKVKRHFMANVVCFSLIASIRCLQIRAQSIDKFLLRRASQRTSHHTSTTHRGKERPEPPGVDQQTRPENKTSIIRRGQRKKTTSHPGKHPNKCSGESHTTSPRRNTHPYVNTSCKPAQRFASRIWHVPVAAPQRWGVTSSLKNTRESGRRLGAPTRC